jgi:hypothetical protein
MDLNKIIKVLIFIIIGVIIMIIFFIIKLINPNLDYLKNESKTNNGFSEKEINDSMNKREERIKALKEVGKKLGG